MLSFHNFVSLLLNLQLSGPNLLVITRFLSFMCMHKNSLVMLGTCSQMLRVKNKAT
jgi:hypothetical protein